MSMNEVRTVLIHPVVQQPTLGIFTTSPIDHQ